MSKNKDIAVLRELAEKIAEISQKEFQKEIRNLWRMHNSLKKTRPLILAGVGRYDCYEYEILTPDKLECADPLYREVEFQLKHAIFKDDIGDDYIIEPWIIVKAKYQHEGWGVEIKHIESTKSGGAYKLLPIIKEIEDIHRLKTPIHSIDEKATSLKVKKVYDAIGDILGVAVDRGPAYRDFGADISSTLVQLIGLEELMIYMYDRPKWLHEILAFMRDGILKVHDEAEKAGHWSLCCGCNQAMTYAEELSDPSDDGKSVGRDMLWAFFASQEYALISPEMFDEFLLQYQMPIMEKFGLLAYGCCEDLTKKIKYLRKVPNLRRIAVTPWADVAKCAEQIGQDYVFSWRPNPSQMVCSGFDETYVRKAIKEGLDASRGCCVDITLKDVQTVRGDIGRIKEWVRVVKNVCEEWGRA